MLVPLRNDCLYEVILKYIILPTFHWYLIIKEEDELTVITVLVITADLSLTLFLGMFILYECYCYTYWNNQGAGFV